MRICADVPYKLLNYNYNISIIHGMSNILRNLMQANEGTEKGTHS